MIKIMKASAGSGKTYNLAKTYLGMLSERYAYRHILAVTFTNKATAEMKNRILRDLAQKAMDDTDARRTLVDILHDYGSFSVTTIDKFFQQTLKAFAREIGQFSSYQVELDKESLIAEAMDRILDSLTEEKTELAEWLKASVREHLETGEKLNIDQKLYEMGRRLKSEEFREIKEKYGIDEEKAFSKGRLASIRRECTRICDNYASAVKTAAVELMPKMDKPRLVGWLTPYANGFKRGEVVKAPNATLMKAAAGSRFAELFSEAYDEYNTVVILLDSLYSLGLAGEFQTEFSSILKERNLMCLDDSNSILRDIIRGSDAPFVYEKIGVRYQNYLLDEFQDTSNIQWENFRPLLQESDANGKDCLVVGDVKQSIYRWRDSDWQLLAEKVPQEFPGACITTLDGNWRSASNIVGFNNGFFTFASRAIGFPDLYSDVRQLVKVSGEPQGGCVRASFCDKEDILQKVYDSVCAARDAGAGWGDIAVLVRGRDDGSLIANYLIDNGIPVISDDSLKVSSSLTVRRLISILSSIENPSDTVGAYLSSSLGLVIPAIYHSLLDLCESMLRELSAADPDTFCGETLFIQAFMDDVRNWTASNGQNLREYLAHWSENKLCIGSPDNGLSLRVLTIHKAKGLEFPYVIFPFAESVNLYKSDWHWCFLETEGTSLPEVLRGAYPVALGKDKQFSCFADNYEAERKMQAVDNINVFYVALTRASKSLHIISATPSKRCRDSYNPVTDERPDPAFLFSNFSELLYAYCGAVDEYKAGDDYDFRQMKRAVKDAPSAFPASYRSYAPAGRFNPSEEASDFFGRDGLVGPDASARLNGIVMHSILSSVSTPDDLESAVGDAVRSGMLDASRAGEVLSCLAGRIGAHPEWFSSDCSNEVTLIDGDGSIRRPDRVVKTGKKTIVIDYKFGERKESYLRQVARYAGIYRRMGYPSVEGYVWYVSDDTVESI